MREKKIILGIETSCDETAAAVVVMDEQNQFKIYSNIVSSQVKIHTPFGGVYPELASREHSQNIIVVVEKALEQAKIIPEDIDAIAVTFGPGLIGSLLIGITGAKTYAQLWQKPLIPVNHLEGHIYANFINNSDIKYPAIGLIVSGGHTLLLEIPALGNYKLIGETLDDAAGEAFDKVAKFLGLSYPGGPALSKLAESGDDTKYAFTLPLNRNDNFDFSFSGIKTAVVNLVNTLGGKDNLTQKQKADICASFQKTAVDSLCKKTLLASKYINAQTLIIGGGVSANRLLRQRLEIESQKANIKFLKPEIELCTDNAVGIAIAGLVKLTQGKTEKSENIKADPIAQIV